MDLRASSLLVIAILVLDISRVAHGNLSFQVHHKFGGGGKSLSELKAHDHKRHGRLLSVIDLNLGGNGLPTEAGLYYTKLAIGSPPKEFHVQVDTGSDVLWVNGAECKECPKKSNLGIELQLYDPKESHTSKPVYCDGDFCKSTYNDQVANCAPQKDCLYSITYGDGGTTSGHFVKDTVTFDQVNDNLQSSPINSSVVFGCGAKQAGGLGSSDDSALDGIMGFGQANSSVLSQIAASGKVKKVFSHCLDTVSGGGIFSIGEVVEPKFNTTSLLPGFVHYNALLTDIEVDDEPLQLSTGILDFGGDRETVIDSGTTLAYIPEAIYQQMVDKTLARQPGLKLHLLEGQFTCFHYSGNVDDGFPVVKFHFEKSLTLKVYPHDYLFNTKDDVYCIGWQKSTAKTKDGADMTLLGDLVLSNRLVVYNLENMTVGWTEFNCSSSIKVKDSSGKVVRVGAHNISSASTLLAGRLLTFLLLLVVVPYSLMN